MSINIYEVVLRLIIAVVIGGAVGYEREFKNRLGAQVMSDKAAASKL